LTEIRTDNVIFHVMSSTNDAFAPGVNYMTFYGKDPVTGAFRDYDRVMTSAATSFSRSVYSDPAKFSHITVDTNDLSKRVQRFVDLQFPPSPSRRYVLTHIGKHGSALQMPFMEFMFKAATTNDPLAQYKIENENYVKVVVQTSGPGFHPGQVNLVEYQAMGVVPMMRLTTQRPPLPNLQSVLRKFGSN
jgi:hypothetical protein